MKKIYYQPWREVKQSLADQDKSNFTFVKAFFNKNRRQFNSIDTAIEFAVRYRGGIVIVEQGNQLIPLTSSKGIVVVNVVTDPLRTKQSKQFEQIQLQVNSPNGQVIFYTEPTDCLSKMIQQFQTKWQTISNKHLW